AELTEVTDRVLDYQHKLMAALSFLPGCEITAPAASRVPGTVHVTFKGLASDQVIFLLDQEGVCASAAASCSSGAETTEHDVDALIGILSSVVYRLRSKA